jgi:uncharacterized protein YqjF (DUF2071 family)
MHENRSYPPPKFPWQMAMTWHDLLFMHWPLEGRLLRPHVPAGLELDLREGSAWLGIVPFGMRGTRPRFFPPFPGLSNFPEINVRTYVIAQGRPGVWFFSLDAASRLAVRGARWFYHLSYYDARMRLELQYDGGVCYQSRRVHRAAPPAKFIGRYRPVGEIFTAVPGSLESWLTDRYCLYAADRKGRLYRGEIDHPPWPLQVGQAEVELNTMHEQLGITLPSTPPLLHFARRIDVHGWYLQRVSR